MRSSNNIKSQLEELEKVLETTKKLEKRQRKIKKNNFQERQLIVAIRASSYLIMYNAIESSMRSVLRSIREQIESENIDFQQVADFWRLDLLQSNFLEKMQNGTNHGNVLSDFIPMLNGKVSWEESKKDRLPNSGNFGQSAAIKFKDQLLINWKAPDRTLNGSDLENIRERRNALAHGLETFREAGDKITSSDLLEIIRRIKAFMMSFLDALEQYRDDRKYTIRPVLTTGHSTVGLSGSLVSDAAVPIQSAE